MEVALHSEAQDSRPQDQAEHPDSLKRFRASTVRKSEEQDENRKTQVIYLDRLGGFRNVFSAVRAASADYLWDWTYICGSATLTKCEGGSGTYTSTQVAQGSRGNLYYVLTGMTGTVEGNTISVLLPPNSFGWQNDNRITAGGGANDGTPFSWNPKHKIIGIEFLTNGNPETHETVDLLYQNYINRAVGDFTQITGPGTLFLESIDLQAKLVSEVGLPVPEPSSLLVFIALGGLMLGGALRKAFQ